MTPTLTAVTDPVTQVPATVRTAVTVPLRFADGCATTARVVPFDGLADGREHLALALGDWEGALGVDRIALLSNDPDEAAQLEHLGVEVSEHVPTAVHPSSENARYLTAEVVRTAHTRDLPLAG